MAPTIFGCNDMIYAIPLNIAISGVHCMMNYMRQILDITTQQECSEEHMGHLVKQADTEKVADVQTDR